MSECIEWAGCKDGCGYGMKRVAGKTERTHRVAYVEHHGLRLEDIKGKDILHTCDNPPCYNPAHLVLGTRGDNNRDRAAKGRSAKALPAKRKITQEQAEHIRSVYKKHSRDSNTVTLAAQYGVDHTTICHILQGRTHR